MFFFNEDPKLSEKEIQILYQTHPYLIESKFLNQKIIPQYSLPSGFADIVVFLENEIVVTELKIENLNYNHLLQLKDYLEDVQSKFKDTKIVRGILIGKTPDKDLDSVIENISFNIKIMILNRDIPIDIKICNICRLANDLKNEKCVYCNNNSFL